MQQSLLLKNFQNPGVGVSYNNSSRRYFEPCAVTRRLEKALRAERHEIRETDTVPCAQRAARTRRHAWDPIKLEHLLFDIGTMLFDPGTMLFDPGTILFAI